MSTDAPQEHGIRQHRFPYTDAFRSLNSSDRQQELNLLKKLYENDRLTIRQIANLVDASYGFVRQRLADAGTTITITRRTRPRVSADATATIETLPSRKARG